jgi:hypothetical protein
MSAGLFLALALCVSAYAADPIGDIQMKHYEDSQWNFALDVPARWNAFPPVSTNSPFEVIRFMSREDGEHLLIVFRFPFDPAGDMTAVIEGAEKNLANAGFSHFVTGEVKVGSRTIQTLNFDQIRGDGTTWSCRYYYFPEGTLRYTLSLGTTNPKVMFPIFDRMAQTFVFEGSTPNASR